MNLNVVMYKPVPSSGPSQPMFIERRRVDLRLHSNSSLAPLEETILNARHTCITPISSDISLHHKMLVVILCVQ
jgi:hypothetical protein